MEKSKIHIITFSDFWHVLKDNINGHFDEKKPNEYHTEDFGTIYRNSSSNILQKLGVDSKRHNSFTELIFNHKKIIKNASQYNISIQTKIELEDSECCERCEHPIGDTTITNQIHIEDNRNNNTKTVNKQENNNWNSPQYDESNEEGDLLNNKNQVEPSDEHTQRSRDHSLSSYSTNFIEEENKKNIYRLGNSDTWACKECKSKGDKWFMKQHFCKRVLKKQQQKAIQNEWKGFL